MFTCYKKQNDKRPVRAIKFTGLNHEATERVCDENVFKDYSIPVNHYIIENPDSTTKRTFIIMEPVEFNDTYTEFDATYILSGEQPC